MFCLPGLLRVSVQVSSRSSILVIAFVGIHSERNQVLGGNEIPSSQSAFGNHAVNHINTTM